MDIDTSPAASPTAPVPVIDSSDGGRPGEGSVPAAGPAWWPRLGRDSAYALTSLPLSVLAVALVAVLVSLGVGLAVLLVGLPILALGLLTARGFAFVERRRLGRLLGTPMVQPTYLSSRPGEAALRRVTAPARDPQSWLDVAWTVVAVFTATLAWSIAVTWWAAALGATTYGIWEQAVPRGSDPHTLASLMGFGTSERADILVISVIGVCALLTLPFALRAAAALHSRMGRDLLCGRAELARQRRA